METTLIVAKDGACEVRTSFGLYRRFPSEDVAVAYVRGLLDGYNVAIDKLGTAFDCTRESA